MAEHTERYDERGRGGLVVVPTYDERENLARIVERVVAAVPDAHILVVDDASPDGTGREADRMSHEDPRIHVMHRQGKLGLGSAYVMGFEWALERGYEFLIQMDADGSHPPETLPQMLAACRDAAGLALVIGSRWVPGGRVENWPRRREVLSRGGNLYARLMLGISVKDATAGFRVYPAAMLRELLSTPVDARGYFFQVAMTARTIDCGYRVIEVPIVFRERERGESKMSSGIVQEAMLKVAVLGWKRRFRRG